MLSSCLGSGLWKMGRIRKRSVQRSRRVVDSGESSKEEDAREGPEWEREKVFL